MRAERIESSLQPRFWSFNRQPEAAARQLVFLSDGVGEADMGNERLAIAAPALLWLATDRPGRLRAEAGATGYRASVSGEMLEAAIGDQMESASLRQLAERNFMLSLAGQDEACGVLDRCLAANITETARQQPGTALVQSALLRILLTTMLRVAGGEDVAMPATGDRVALLQRFRQLVELNFRNRWPVSRYALELGVSGDRLHAICTSAVGKPPKRLIAERLAHEAAMRLERSTLTIQQLGHALGFNDPAHFSNFFRRITGLSPGEFRRNLSAVRRDSNPAAAPSFVEWP